MLPSPNAYELVKTWEQFRPTAYKPTRKDVWTIGWGHTRGVCEGDTCTHDQAQTWLEDDMHGAVEAVRHFVAVPLTQNQFDALCSLVFNIGAGNFEESTLLRKLNDRDYGGALAEFERWTKQRGDILRGLEYRRAAEKLMASMPADFAPTPKPVPV